MIVMNANTGNIFKIINEPRSIIEACGNGGNGNTGLYPYCVGVPAFE